MGGLDYELWPEYTPLLYWDLALWLDDEELKTKEKEIRDKLVMKLKKQPEKNSHAKKLKKSKTEGTYIITMDQ